MYICLECGHIFEDGEEKRWTESRGEFWGMACSEEMTGCPICEGDYEEAKECEICHSAHLGEDLNGGVCDECIDRYRNNFDLCDNICAGQKTEIKINALIASILDVGDIEAILTNYIKKRMSNVDCSQFIDSDIEWFGEQIAKGGKRK